MVGNQSKVKKRARVQVWVQKMELFSVSANGLFISQKVSRSAGSKGEQTEGGART